MASPASSVSNEYANLCLATSNARWYPLSSSPSSSGSDEAKRRWEVLGPRPQDMAPVACWGRGGGLLLLRGDLGWGATSKKMEGRECG